MEIEITKKSTAVDIKTTLSFLVIFTIFSILAQLYNNYFFTGNALVNTIQTLLPYLIYISMLYVMFSMLLLAIGEFGKRG
jgi:hypothetical protein